MKKLTISTIGLGLCLAAGANASTPAHFVTPTHIVTPTHFVGPAHVVWPHVGKNTVTDLCANNGSNCKVYVNCTGKSLVVHASGWMNDITMNPRDYVVDISSATRLDVYNTQDKLLAEVSVQASDSETNSLYAIAKTFFVSHRDEDTNCL